jgi:predicted deacylase
MPRRSLPDFEIAGTKVAAGTRKRVVIDVAWLHDFTDMHVPVQVVRGTKPGPVLFVSAALHGDEINGVETVRRLLGHPALKRIRGTLLAVPVVNVFGFNGKSRYLPDRRDLNRCFPGSPSGSLGAQLADSFMREIVARSDYGIDLHTAATGRCNMPHVRVSMSDKECARLAYAFGGRVILDSPAPKGALREAARAKGVPLLTFEGGEPLRFDEDTIQTGLFGILNVMRAIAMLPRGRRKARRRTVYVAHNTHWLRAPAGGIFEPLCGLGRHIAAGEPVGRIVDPFAEREIDIFAKSDGVIVGRAEIPLVNRGDAVFHIASVEAGIAPFEEMDLYEDAVEAKAV